MKTVTFSAKSDGGTVEYTKIPAGWTSAEKVEVGTVRVIDGKVYYVGTSYTHSWPKVYKVNWYPMRDRMYEHNTNT